MGRLLRLLLLGSCLTLPARAEEAAYTPPKPPGKVIVYRGGAADRPGSVPVYRGSAVAPAWSVTAPPEDRLAGTAVVAGERLWLVNPGTGQLTACRDERSVNYGKRRMACATRPLPD